MFALISGGGDYNNNNNLKQFINYINNVASVDSHVKGWACSSKHTDELIIPQYLKGINLGVAQALFHGLTHNQSISARWKVMRNCIPSKEKSQLMYSMDMKELANELKEFLLQ